MISQGKRRTQNFGFSLIEVVVALAILSVGLIALSQFQSSIIRTNTLAKERAQAVTFAQQGIEKSRSEISKSPTNSFMLKAMVDQSVGASTTFTSKTTTYTRKSTSTKLANGDVELKIQVSWPDLEQGDGLASNQTTVYLSTIISRQAHTSGFVELPYVTISSTTTSTTSTTICADGDSSGGAHGGCGGMK